MTQTMILPLDAMCATDDNSVARLFAGAIALRDHRDRDRETSRPVGQCITPEQWRARA